MKKEFKTELTFLQYQLLTESIVSKIVQKQKEREQLGTIDNNDLFGRKAPMTDQEFKQYEKLLEEENLLRKVLDDLIGQLGNQF